MEHHKRRLLAVCLSALAGYVDALGFLSLGGLFVSFMSGNSTKLGVSIAQGAWGEAGTAVSLIIVFVLGATLGAAVGRLAGARRPPAVMAAVCAVLAASVLLHWAGGEVGATLLLAAAMGTQNAVFEGDAELFPVTFMTGAMVKIGQQLAAMVLGHPTADPVFQAASWVAFICGSVVGATAWAKLHLDAGWFAVGLAGVLAVAATRLRPTGR